MNMQYVSDGGNSRSATLTTQQGSDKAGGADPYQHLYRVDRLTALRVKDKLDSVSVFFKATSFPSLPPSCSCAHRLRSQLWQKTLSGSMALQALFVTVVVMSCLSYQNVYLNALTADSLLSTHPRHKAMAGRQAVVMNTASIAADDDCRLERFRHLAAVTTTLPGFDVWLLHEQGAEVRSEVREIAATSAGRVFVAPKPMVKNVHDYFNFSQSKRTNAQYASYGEVYFRHWLVYQTTGYDHAWFVEDDVVVVGAWADVLANLSASAGDNADFVVDHRKQSTADWYFTKYCRFHGTPCNFSGVEPAGGSSMDGEFFHEAMLPFFRMSRRFAAAVIGMELAGTLRGHPEQVLVLACTVMGLDRCTRRRLVRPPGFFELGTVTLTSFSTRVRVF